MGAIQRQSWANSRIFRRKLEDPIKDVMPNRGDIRRDPLARINGRLTQRLDLLLPGTGEYALVAGLAACRRDSVQQNADDGGSLRLGIVLQGKKCVQERGKSVCISEHSCFVNHAEGPASGYVTEAPYLSLSVLLDHRMLRRLLGEHARVNRIFPNGGHAIAATADPGLLDAFGRLLTLVEQPDHIRHLAPLFLREIHYRMLIGPLGGRLRQLARYAGPCSSRSMLQRIMDQVRGI